MAQGKEAVRPPGSSWSTGWDSRQQPWTHISPAKLLKLDNLATNMFLRKKCDKFWNFLPKDLKGWSEKLETWHVEVLDPVLKKVRRQQFSPGSPSVWICHSKYTNIFKTCISRSIWIWFLRAMYPNMNWKCDCKDENIQIFASEIILAWENGSKGYHFGKYSISKLLKDLTQCAMFCVSMIYTNCIDINGIWGTVGTVNSGTHCNNRGLTLVLQMF